MSSLPLLTPQLLASNVRSRSEGVLWPDPSHLSLPVRALQFGTGAFLRGFVDFFVDEANRHGRFNGRVVAIGSTGSGRDALLNAQAGLYTLVSQGTAHGAVPGDIRIVSSVQRALSATSEWEAVLALARLPELEFIFSNTSEVGIALDDTDDLSFAPPRSFPGKLTRFLLERARATNFDRAHSVMVLPCELVERNGDRLRDIVLQLAAKIEQGEMFVAWMRESVHFCNTLVDRIVPGAPSADEGARLEAAIGYRDTMLTTCEPFRLFAIEAPPAIRSRLSFLETDAGVLLVDDIAPFVDRKVRLLNGAHTLLAPFAMLCGLDTVRDAIDDELVGPFVRRALFDEMVPTLPGIGAERFAADVLERFANPFIRHAVVDITLHATTKWRVRIVPTIQRAATLTGHVPAALAFGFAAHLLYARGDVQAARRQSGASVPPDLDGESVRTAWACVNADDDDAVAAMVRRLCTDAVLWGSDLSSLPDFGAHVTTALLRMLRTDVPCALRAFMTAEVVSA